MTTTRLTHEYTGRGSVLQLMRDRSAEVLLAGPAGTGKSLGCLEKLNAVALKYPGMRGLITRKTHASLPSSALATLRKLVIRELIDAGSVYFHGGGPQDPPQYRYPNGSVINIGGMDKPSRIMSTEYDVAYVQEATELTLDDWEAITTRLRNWRMPYQQLIADCNPSYPTHWLKQRADAGATKMYSTCHEENPVLFEEDGTLTVVGADYLSKLDALTGVRHARLRSGLWAAAEGVIYDEWSDANHMVDKFEIPQAWPRLWSVDFGFTHPFVLQCWAIDPDGRMFLYRELYRTGQLVEDHAKRILSLVTKGGVWTEPKPLRVVCDHDAEGRATLSKELRLPIVAAQKAVTDGIQAVQARLRKAGDGRPRIFLCRDAVVDRDPVLVDAKRPTCTADEVPGYIWAPGPNGQPAKEQPVKDMDDGLDALRYAVMSQERSKAVLPKIRIMGA